MHTTRLQANVIECAGRRRQRCCCRAKLGSQSKLTQHNLQCNLASFSSARRQMSASAHAHQTVSRRSVIGMTTLPACGELLSSVLVARHGQAIAQCLQCECGNGARGALTSLYMKLTRDNHVHAACWLLLTQLQFELRCFSPLS